MNCKMHWIIVSILVGLSHSDNVGWKKQFEENEEEFHNIPLKWEMGSCSNIPTWLNGVYVRNGPAKVVNIRVEYFANNTATIKHNQIFDSLIYTHSII